MTALSEAFGETLTPARLRIYAAALADIQTPALADAFKRAVLELKYFPKIAELREFAQGTQRDRDQVDANAAWAEAIDVIQRHWHPDIGYSGSTRLSPRTAYAVRNGGGMYAIWNSGDADPFLRKRFEEAFRVAPLAAERRPLLGPGGRKLLKDTDEVANKNS